MTAIFILLIILMVGIMFLLPPAIQYFKFGIDPERFAKLKISKLCFMFRGLGKKDGGFYSVKEYGVIAPMFAIQVLGYAFALVTAVAAPLVAGLAGISLEQTVFMVLYMLVAEVIICAVTVAVCAIISKTQSKKAD